MKKISVLMLSLILFGGTMIFLPSFSSGFSTTYLNPNYTASSFLTNPNNFSFISLAFDANKNLYTEPYPLFGKDNTVYIRELAAPDYSTISPYISYAYTDPTFEYGVSGLNFGGTNLNVAEISADLDHGLIRRIDTNSKTIISTYLLPSFRPTGITNDSAGNIYFPGRLNSDPGFGNIYKLDSNNIRSTVIDGFVATGIAYYGGNLFLSTAANNSSIYMYDLTTQAYTLMATFDEPIEELTFDQQGNLYVLEGITGEAQQIFELSRVPEPSTMLLLGSGLLGLWGLRRKFRK